MHVHSWGLECMKHARASNRRGGVMWRRRRRKEKKKGKGWSEDDIHAAVVAEDISRLDQGSNDITHLSLSVDVDLNWYTSEQRRRYVS